MIAIEQWLLICYLKLELFIIESYIVNFFQANNWILFDLDILKQIYSCSKKFFTEFWKLNIVFRNLLKW